MIPKSTAYAVAQKTEDGWLIVYKASKKLAGKRLRAEGGFANGYRIYITNKDIGETIEG